MGIQSQARLSDSTTRIKREFSCRTWVSCTGCRQEYILPASLSRAALKPTLDCLSGTIVRRRSVQTGTRGRTSAVVGDWVSSETQAENPGTPWLLRDDVFIGSPVMFTGSPGRLSLAGRALRRAGPPALSTLLRPSVAPCPPPQPSSA